MNKFFTAAGLKIIKTILVLWSSLALFMALAFAQEGELRPELLPGEEGTIEELVDDEGLTEINVRNADLEAVIRIFSRTTGRNYILDERVRGRVTIYLPARVTPQDSIRILDSVLSLKGFASVPIGDNLWKIVPATEARQTSIPTIADDQRLPEVTSAAMVTRLLNLRFVGADEIRQLLTPMISPAGLINAYAGTNSLIIIDSEDNVQRLEQIISSMDVPYRDRDMTVIPIVHADAVDIALKLNEILGDSEHQEASTDPQALTQQAIRARIREAARQAAQARAGGGQAEGVTRVSEVMLESTGVTSRVRAPRIIADERTNSVLVIADDETTARIRALVSQLDSEVNLSGTRFYVYRCQHAKAEELAAILSNLMTGGSAAGNGFGGAERITQDAFGQATRLGSRPRAEAFERTAGRIERQQRTPGQSRGVSERGSLGLVGGQLADDIFVAADPATNSLIIHASRAGYERMLFLLERLDIKRRQVLVEAMLLEVGVDETINLGTDWLASGGGADGGIFAQSNFGPSLGQILSDPTQVSQFSAAAASAGTLTLPGNITIPTQAVLLSAAQSNSNINVLSAPTILATDNEPAEIVVGQNVPFLASRSTSTADLSNVFNQIDRQDVGITLRLTPQISSSDFVTLNLFTEVSSLIAATVASELGPTTTIRTSETTVIAKSGQMVVIGGLMSDDLSENESGIPFIKDIPFFGHMFKRRTEDRRRTNLLIFISPRVIRDQFDAREMTIVRRDKMEDIIASNEVFPNRSEILRSFEIDTVTQARLYSGEQPGTITAPRKPRIEKTERVDHSLLPGQSTEDGVEALRLRVQPLIPQVKEEGTVERFIVLKALDGTEEVLSALPFSLSKNNLLGLDIPLSAAPSTFSFFKQGHLYAYMLGDTPVRFRVLGLFSTAEQAASLHSPVAGRWYVPSPHELLNLGESPWRLIESGGF
jgi:general secretion pathway protein D